MSLTQDSEIKNLRGTLQEAEEAQIQQKKVYDDVVNERDQLGSHVCKCIRVWRDYDRRVCDLKIFMI